jgi:hypothetical protein
VANPAAPDVRAWAERNATRMVWQSDPEPGVDRIAAALVAAFAAGERAGAERMREAARIRLGRMAKNATLRDGELAVAALPLPAADHSAGDGKAAEAEEKL